MMKKKLMIGLGVLALIVAIMAYQFLTPKGEINVANAATAYELQAADLYTAFEQDEVAANKRYANTIVAVNGTITSVEKNENGQLQISLDAQNPLGAVVCTLQESSSELEDFKVGSTVAIKGVCTGYLFDVVIDRAILAT